MAAVARDGSLTVLRLDPLTDSDVGTILDAHPRVDDGRGFIREAREKRVDGFLTNPQSLNMLADVVGGGNWPENRLELFEQACRRMAREHNDEHLAAARSSDGAPVPTGGLLLEDLLDAAGRLCAVQLIAGAAGYALTPSRESRDFPAFDRCEGEWDSDRASHRGQRRSVRAASRRAGHQAVPGRVQRAFRSGTPPYRRVPGCQVPGRAHRGVGNRDAACPRDGSWP